MNKITLKEFYGTQKVPDCYSEIHGHINPANDSFVVTNHDWFFFPLRDVHGTIYGAAIVQANTWIGSHFERQVGGYVDNGKKRANF